MKERKKKTGRKAVVGSAAGSAVILAILFWLFGGGGLGFGDGNGSGNGNVSNNLSDNHEMTGASQTDPDETPETETETETETASEQQGDLKEPYLIEVKSDRIYLDGTEVTFEELQKQLMNLDSSQCVIELRSNNHIKATYDKVEAFLNEYSFYFSVTYAATP